MFSCICWACFISPASWFFIMVRLLPEKRICGWRRARRDVRRRALNNEAALAACLAVLTVPCRSGGRARRMPARCFTRPDRALHDARAEIADERLHERIALDFLLGLL